MSGILGIWNLDGRPIEECLLAKLSTWNLAGFMNLPSAVYAGPSLGVLAERILQPTHCGVRSCA